MAVIDPGPEDEAHFQALMAALAGREVTHIFVSHTHRDHSPLARRLKAATGALTVGEGAAPRGAAAARGRDQSLCRKLRTWISGPDIAIGDGETIEGDGWALTGVLTPGHTANHAAFALEGTADVLFSADHVMAWATTIVAPPDGSMADYMASLDKLIARHDRLLLPGHGGPVTSPAPFMRALKTHRRMRRARRPRPHPGGGQHHPWMVEGDLPRYRSAPAWRGSPLGAGPYRGPNGARRW